MAEWWWKLVRFGFRLLYNELAFTYDTVSVVVSLGAWGCWQRAALKHLDPPTAAPILEIAHGTGNLQLDLHAAGYKAIGLDLSPAMGRIAGRKLIRRRLPCRLVRGRAQQLPFATASVASVICTFPTDFIFAAETLHEIRRVLMPEGKLIIVPNGQLMGSSIIINSLEWLYRVTGQRGGGGDARTLFQSFGFQIETFTENCPRSQSQIIVARKST